MGSDMFYHYKGKFIAEHNESRQSLFRTGNKVSNLKGNIKKILEIDSKLTAI